MDEILQNQLVQMWMFKMNIVNIYFISNQNGTRICQYGNKPNISNPSKTETYLSLKKGDQFPINKRFF